MTNYRLTIQYDGARYSGWQIQGNTEKTIQGKLQRILSEIDHHEVEVNGSGRTDAGVHAKGQIANAKLTSSISCDELQRLCNESLPNDIAVISVEKASDRFHARLNAVSKSYRYTIWNSAVPNVFLRSYSAQIPDPLNLNAMREAAAALTGTHDFRSFCGLRRFKKSTIRTVFSIEIQSDGPLVTITYTGNGFLNQMVRIMTGTLVEIGLGKRSPDAVPAILNTLDRSASGPSMPPQGLCLEQVSYD